ncbi:MAG: hypothetical protein RMI34_02270 [Chloroherpetonaceae bacterium]|nr:hypothetical protein [Chloroherpetonaceae bacterium]MCS7212569.1 hypothetical protein [Chloroherpetonaceae bacterium]MDW8018881.1 hypothetical protein [Chloroherpetonaceae bacterium]
MHITIAFSCFLVNFLYGILAKLRVVDAARFKVVHHVMYFFVMASLVAAVSLEIYERGVPVPLLVMVVALLGMTRFSGKSSWHWRYAVLCLVMYLAVAGYYFYRFSQ